MSTNFFYYMMRHHERGIIRQMNICNQVDSFVEREMKKTQRLVFCVHKMRRASHRNQYKQYEICSVLAYQQDKNGTHLNIVRWKRKRTQLNRIMKYIVLSNVHIWVNCHHCTALYADGIMPLFELEFVYMEVFVMTWTSRYGSLSCTTAKLMSNRLL